AAAKIVERQRLPLRVRKADIGSCKARLQLPMSAKPILGAAGAPCVNFSLSKTGGGAVLSWTSRTLISYSTKGMPTAAIEATKVASRRVRSVIFPRPERKTGPQVNSMTANKMWGG